MIDQLRQARLGRVGDQLDLLRDDMLDKSTGVTAISMAAARRCRRI